MNRKTINLMPQTVRTYVNFIKVFIQIIHAKLKSFQSRQDKSSCVSELILIFGAHMRARL